MVRRTRRGALLDLLGGRGTRSEGSGVATLDRGPDQSLEDKDHISQSLGTKGNQEAAPYWVECRSCGTRGPPSGMDMFPDLSRRAKLYCGGKCS